MSGAVSKLSVGVASELAKAVRLRVGGRGLSRFVAQALAHELEREQHGSFLGELDAELGEVSKSTLAIDHVLNGKGLLVVPLSQEIARVKRIGCPRPAARRLLQAARTRGVHPRGSISRRVFTRCGYAPEALGETEISAP